MRIAFAGTPDFAVPALHALCDAGHEVALVFSQPDRPAGRGRRLTASAVSQAAETRALATAKPERFDANALARLQAAEVECMVVVAYGLILPQAALDIPPRGCLNIHASLLPRWRGAAPVARAIEAGDRDTGVCIMQMDAGLDTGPVWRRRAVAIADDDTAGTLAARLAALGAAEVVAALEDILDPARQPQAQSEDGACYARKLSKEEARIDWRQSAACIARRVRAYNPAPVAWSQCGDARLRIFAAQAKPSMPERLAPGSVGMHEGTLLVATGDGALRLDEVQWPGGRPQPAMQLHQRLAGQQLT